MKDAAGSWSVPGQSCPKVPCFHCQSTLLLPFPPGAATSDIVQQYIFSIRAMRHVDPTGR